MIKHIVYGMAIVVFIILLGHAGSRWLSSQGTIIPVVPCGTDTDCMQKNPHLGDY
jgi:hypothetical protein